jgi:glycosyltransferase involved in cell wall biosynthesis
MGTVRPRVAIVSSWYPSAAAPGAGVFVREQARAASRVADVAVVHLEPDEAARRGAWSVADAEQDGLRTLRVRVRRPHTRGLAVALAAAGLRKALDRIGPDVIHAHVFSTAVIALAARRRRTPLVISEHASAFARGHTTALDRRIARTAYARADLVCPVSDGMASELKAIGVTAPLRVVPNAIDTERFHPRAGPRAPGPTRALVVANLTEIKQLHVLLDALSELRGSIELDVVGDGPLAPALQQQAAERGIENSVRFHGWRPADEVAELMRAADLFVLPSRWESQGVVLLEAIASGLPIVATRVGAIPEIVGPEAGVLVEPGDAKALASAMADVARRLADFDAAALHTQATDRYGLAALARTWGAIYEELIAARHRASATLPRS